MSENKHPFSGNVVTDDKGTFQRIDLDNMKEVSDSIEKLKTPSPPGGKEPETPGSGEQVGLKPPVTPGSEKQVGLETTVTPGSEKQVGLETPGSGEQVTDTTIIKNSGAGMGGKRRTRGRKSSRRKQKGSSRRNRRKSNKGKRRNKK